MEFIRNSRILLAILLGLSLSPMVSAQDSHVQSRYFKDIDRTVVKSDFLYVVNRPGQFIQLQMTGRYPKKGPPTEVPDRIFFQFESFAAAPLYKLDATHRFAVKADDRILDFGLMNYSVRYEVSKDKYFERSATLGISSVLPPSAQVRTAVPLGLTLEFMSVPEISLSDLSTMADARQVVMKIGDTTFALTATQMAIMREFAASITPAGTPANRVSPEPLPPDVPSDHNNASLAATLAWLAKGLERNSPAKEAFASKIETIEFKSCQISYRTVPVVRTSSVSEKLVYAIMEYQINLADLNPEAVSVANFTNYSAITFRTRNIERRIDVITRANDSGMAGRVKEEHRFSSTSVSVSMETFGSLAWGFVRPS